MHKNFENIPKIKEKIKKERNPDEEIQTQLEQEGWQKAGQVCPFTTPKLNSKAIFEKKRIFTNEQIKKKYLDMYGNDFDEVQIEVSHQHIMDEWRPSEDMVYVYMRKSLEKVKK